MVEGDIVRKIQSGDLEALGKIFEIYKDQAIKYSYLITGDKFISEDVVQETFIKCYLNASRLKNTDHFKAWFFKILTRTAWRHMGKAKIELPIENIFERADYKATDKEKSLIKKGELQIGYGLDEINEVNTQYVCWEEDGLKYSILNMGHDDVSGEEMIEMAKEIIDK